VLIGPLATIVIATAVAIAILHWLPWNRWIGHELQPPYNYLIGVSTLLAGYVAWVAWCGPTVFPYHPWMAAVGLVAIAAGAGAADLIAYWIDRKTGDRMFHRVFGGNGENGPSDRS